MKFLFQCSRVFFVFACFSLFISFSFAEGKTIVSPTVKIVSYNLTNNNHVLEQGSASGTLISASGLLLTNYHVVTDNNDQSHEAFAICVVTDTQKKPECLYTASLIAKDKSADIAMLQVNPKDVYGKDIPAFPFLSATNEVLPNIGDKVFVGGFPAIGGETITFTEGKVSGYEEKEGIQFMKTDATISFGNSGGTAKNEQGAFVGVPSFIKSDMGTIGYIIPLKEIQTWIAENIQKQAEKESLATGLLSALLLQKYKADNETPFVSPVFPYFQLTIQKPWEIEFFNDANLVLSAEVKGNALQMRFSVTHSAYPVTEKIMQFILGKIEKNQHQYRNYKREVSSLDGKTGYLIQFDTGSTRYFYFLSAIENTLFTYYYNISLENIEETSKAQTDLLASLHFLEKANNTIQYRQSFSQEYPNISLQTLNDFYIVPELDSSSQDAIVSFENPNSLEQVSSLSESFLRKDFLTTSRSDMLKEELKSASYNYNDYNLLKSYEDVRIDGLSGFAYMFSYRGDNFEETRNNLTVVIIRGEKSFRFEYDDLKDAFEKNLSTFIQTLESFQYSGEENMKTKGEYHLPQFKNVLKDVQYHVYEEEITALIAKNILPNAQPLFFPDREMSRISALDAMIQSKIFIEDGRNIQTTKNAIAAQSDDVVFQDQKNKKWNKMLKFLVEEKVISSGENFFPQRGITVAEALKILCELYDIPTWNPPYKNTIAWHVPYMYYGQKLGIIPAGTSADSVLTRGQFAWMLYHFTSIVGERNDL